MNGDANGATTTIDRAGRLVVPKEVREQAGLEPGVPLLIRYRDGRIEIEPRAREIRVERRGRVHVAVAVEPGEPLTDEIVNDTLRRMRERDE
jgi:AbrB family looped-hinge helix DNA binding protein